MGAPVCALSPFSLFKVKNSCAVCRPLETKISAQGASTWAVHKISGKKSGHASAHHGTLWEREQKD